MRTFRRRIQVGAGRAGAFISIDAVVDTGATYSQIPETHVGATRVTAIGQRQFTLADGRSIPREIAEAYVRLDGQVRSTISVIGEPGMPPILGASTLEGFGLSADPVNRRLVETTLYLL